MAERCPQTYGLIISHLPVAKVTYGCLLISLATSSYWPLHQVDINNVFLHSDLKEEVYIKQPLEFVAQERE